MTFEKLGFGKLFQQKITLSMAIKKDALVAFNNNKQIKLCTLKDWLSRILTSILSKSNEKYDIRVGFSKNQSTVCTKVDLNTVLLRFLCLYYCAYYVLTVSIMSLLYLLCLYCA